MDNFLELLFSQTTKHYRCKKDDWATITDANQPYPQFRGISTKAAFGWRYLFPDNPYAQKVFDAVKDLRSPDDSGYYAGIYEESKQPNKALTGNTNGLILEILYYKAKGNHPLIASGSASVSTGKPSENASPATPSNQPNSPVTTPADTSKPTEVAVAPIPPVDSPNSSSNLKLDRPLSVIERRYAEAAWRYFQANYHSKSGLIDDRSDFKGATLWGLAKQTGIPTPYRNRLVWDERRVSRRFHLSAI